MRQRSSRFHGNPTVALATDFFGHWFYETGRQEVAFP